MSNQPTPSQDDGATKVPVTDSSDNCIRPGGSHSWQWVWKAGVWTNVQRCQRCGAEREVIK